MSSNRTCWTAANHRYSQVLWGEYYTNSDKKCLSCSLENIRQKNIPKKKEHTAKKDPGERIYLDVSSRKDESLCGRRHWAMLVDEATRCKHSFFLKKKSDQGLKDKYKIQVKFKKKGVMLERIRNLKKSVMQKDWASFLNICRESLSNFDGKNQSYDELCRVHNRETKTAMV